MTAITALAIRNAAFEEALRGYTLARSNALGTYPLKARARSPLVGDKYQEVCEQAKVAYREARALAQEVYLATLAAEEAEWEAGLDDDDDEWEAGL